MKSPQWLCFLIHLQNTEVTGYILITVIKIIAVNTDNGFMPYWQQQVVVLLKDKAGHLHCVLNRFRKMIISSILFR